MTEDAVVVNPNSADLEALITLPGVGESMAQRILAARPFTDGEDMLRISGLGPATLARMEPFLTFESSPDSGVAEVGRTDETVADETVSKPEAPVDGRQPKIAARPKRSKKQKPSLMDQMIAVLQERFSLVVVTAGISVVLSVLLTLSILAGINGTLNIRNHASLRLVESEISTLQVEVNNLISRLEAINLRLEAIEGLSGRVQTVEDQFTTLREDVSGSLDDLAEMQTQIEEMDTDIDSISQSVDRFEQFLQGLGQLILEALPSLEPTSP
jgi:methyl-accepting chemotaxis protein